MSEHSRWRDARSDMAGVRAPTLSILGLLLATVALAGGLAAPVAGQQPTAERPAVTAWARDHAVPLATVDPTAPLGDLAPFGESVGRARIVGLGESVHGAAEEITLKHRALRFLIERRGFRTVAWEDDWTIGRLIDRYIRTGQGNPEALVARMSPQWQSGEVADVLRWLRAYNRGRADKVRFFGVEYYLTRRLAYDAVEAYVARTAPGMLPELRHDLRPIRPKVDIWQHIGWYERQKNKAPYIRHAREVYRLVASLRPADGRRHAVALHHARQIRSFYLHYAMSPADGFVYRDAQAAKSLRWWRDFSGDRIAYWAALPHTANAPQLRIAMPGPDLRFRSVGSYLRHWYGERYRSIGFTFDHGEIRIGPGQTATLPRPEPAWFERPFGAVRADQFVLDLRHAAPPPVRRWLAEPLTTRGPGPGTYLDGGTARQWLDVIVHRQEITAVRAP
jgi:erythromycin esterase-like protein